jgi:hypothetical protein
VLGQVDVASKTNEIPCSRCCATRHVKDATIEGRVQTVRRFQAFTGEYPWAWQPVDVEEFSAQLLSGPAPRAVSTVRSYQGTLRLFCEFLTDPRYGWAAECEARVGTAPVQVCHEWNTVAHVAEFEGRPQRRALTYEEVQALFDAADGRVEEIRRRGRKGALAAMRDAHC